MARDTNSEKKKRREIFLLHKYLKWGVHGWGDRENLLINLCSKLAAKAVDGRRRKAIFEVSINSHFIVFHTTH
jgi:hypothetical protein